MFTQSYLQVNEYKAIKRKCLTSLIPIIEKCHMSGKCPSDKVKQDFPARLHVTPVLQTVNGTPTRLKKCLKSSHTTWINQQHKHIFVQKINRGIVLSQTTATEINEMSAQTSFRAEGSVTQEKVMSHDCTTSAGLLPLRAPSLINSLH